MHPMSAGQRNESDGNQQGAEKDDSLNKTFGEEGTNKTQPVPDPKAKPSDVPSGGKHIEPSPYTR
jgi:hypothetical protein